MKPGTILFESIKDKLGGISSKRITLFIIVLVMSIGFMVSLYSVKSPSPAIVEALTWIALACIGGSSAEKFAKTKTKTNEEN